MLPLRCLVWRLQSTDVTHGREVHDTRRLRLASGDAMVPTVFLLPLA